MLVLKISGQVVDQIEVSYTSLDTVEERQAHIEGLASWMKTKHVCCQQEPYEIYVEGPVSKVSRLIEYESFTEKVENRERVSKKFGVKLRKKEFLPDDDEEPKPIVREKGKYSNKNWWE